MPAPSLPGLTGWPQPGRPSLAAVALGALVAVASVPVHVARAQEPRETVALAGATLHDGSGATIADAVVVMTGDRISAAGPRGRVKVPRGARVIDVSGAHLVPGLIDAHVHFFQSGGLYTRPDAIDLRATRPYAAEQQAIRDELDDTFRRYLGAGVTSVVDCGGPRWNFEVRRRAGATALAPRVAVAGPLISTVARPQLDLGDPPIVRAATPEEARALVRAQAADRPVFIKIWFVQTPERPFDEILGIARAAIDEAHKAGLRVAVHATELEAARATVQAGADVLVHSVGDKDVDDAFVRLLKERGVPLIPTLVVHDGYAEVLGAAASKAPSPIEQQLGSPSVMATWREWPLLATEAARATAAERRKRLLAGADVRARNLVKLARAGVVIAAGTDAGNIGTLPGASLHEELAAMERAGLTRAEVLRAATADAARVIAEKPEVGTIAPGKLADLLVLDGDPRADLANLRKARLIVRGGVARAPGDILPPNPAWLVDRQLEAYNARDLERFVAFYADDVVITDLPGGAARITGKAALREVYGKRFAGAPALHAAIEQRTVSGEFVIDHELVTGVPERPYLRAVAISQVQAGLIRRVWFLPKE